MLRQAVSLVYMLVMASRCSAVYWCDVRQAVANGSIPLSSAFRGDSVNVVYLNSDDELSKYHESEDRWTGFLPSIMEATAQAGGFSVVANSSNGPDPGEDFTQWLLRLLAAGETDIIADWTYNTAKRRELGILIPHDFLDVSQTTVIFKPRPAVDSWLERMFNFSKPFHWGLWLMLLAAMCITGVTMWCVERNNWKVSSQESSDFSGKLSTQPM